MSMSRNKKFLLSCLLVFVFTVCIGYIAYAHKTTKPSVKGVSTNISPTPTVPPISTPIPTPTSTPTPTIKPVSYQKQTTPQAKQYGGWYWQPDLNKAQVWIGTDSAGKDIWIDDFPAPTPTPTPKTATHKSSSTQTTASNTPGTSSMGDMTQAVQTKLSEKK